MQIVHAVVALSVALVEQSRFAVEYQLNRWGVETRDERGFAATEMAVLIGALVAIAVVGGVIFMSKMRSNANAIPDAVPPPT
jgi:inactivated superfamily I helicase